MITRHGFIIWTTTADDSQNTQPLRAAPDAVFLRLETAKPAIRAKNNLKIAGIATVATGIAKSAIHQAIDYKGKSSRNSKNSRNSNSNAPKLKKQGITRLETAAVLPVTLLALRHAKALENGVFEGVKTAKGHLKGHLAGITKKKGLHPCECNPLIRIWWDMCDSNARPPNKKSDAPIPTQKTLSSDKRQAV